MPQFDFRAIDAQGQTQVGSLSAANANEVVRHLSSHGMRVQHVAPASGGVSQVALRPSPSPSQRPVQTVATPSARPVARAQAVPAISPGGVSIHQTSTAKPQATQTVSPFDPVTRTKVSNDKDIYFVFAQLSNLFRSGITPSQAMEDMAARQRKKGWPEAFMHIAKLVANGTPLSTAMEVYDGIFPPGACGAVAAGEMGGYLWQACEQVAEEAKRSLKLKRVYTAVAVVFWSNVLTIPMVMVGGAAIRGAVKSINQTQISPLQMMGRDALQTFLGPIGLLQLVVLVAYLVARWWLAQPRARQLRHNAVATVPLIKERTKSENASAFAYHLEMLQNAAISPHRAWAAAARAVPNMRISQNLGSQVLSMNETTRLSEGFAKTRIFPEEFGHLLQTGEMSGSVGKALEDSRQMSQTRANQYQAVLIAKGFLWIALLTFAMSALTIGYVLNEYYMTALHEIPKASNDEP